MKNSLLLALALLLLAAPAAMAYEHYPQHHPQPQLHQPLDQEPMKAGQVIFEEQRPDDYKFNPVLQDGTQTGQAMPEQHRPKPLFKGK